MTVTTSLPGTGIIRAFTDQSTKLSAVLNKRESIEVTSAKGVDAASAVNVGAETAKIDTALLSRVGSVNVAITSTKLDVIGGGAVQVQQLLGQLQSLASRASLAGIPESELAVINGQFQALRIAINNVPPAPPGAEFNPAALLAGLQVDVPEEDTDAVLGGFDDNKLLGDANVLTTESAKSSIQTIATASVKIASQRATIGRLQDTVEFAAASVDSAVQNQEALKASFDDLDTVAPSLAAVLQDQTSKAQAVQTVRLPNNILQLLNQ
jgi:hypothetical protein